MTWDQIVNLVGLLALPLILWVLAEARATRRNELHDIKEWLVRVEAKIDQHVSDHHGP